MRDIKNQPYGWAVGGLMVFAITLLAFGTLRNYEDKNAESAFRVAAQEKIGRLNISLRLALDKLRALGAYYDTNIEIDRHTFHVLTHAQRNEPSPIQALEWIPRVLDSDRDRYIKAARNEGFPAFDFTESESQGALVLAGKRSAYYPAYFIEPLSGNEKAFGFDLASNPARQAVLEKAITTGQLSATNRIILVQEKSDQYGVLVFRPVYQDGVLPATAEQRIARLKGLLVGAFKLGDIVDGLDKEFISKVDLTLFDDSAISGERLLYPKNSQANTAEDIPAAYRMTREFDGAGHTWSVVATPKAGAFSANRDVSITTLLLGLLISALWTYHLRQKSIQQANIQRSAEQMAMLENDVIGIVKVRNRKILWANPAFEKMLGYRSGELVGIPTRQNYPSEEAYQAFGDAAYPLIEAGMVFRGQMEHVRRDGALIWVDINGGVLNPGSGETLWCFFDATDRHNAELMRSSSEELVFKNRALEEASRMKSEFLDTMSHELRTPLNAINGFSEVLRDGLLGELALQQKEYVEEIFTSGTHLLSLINGILDLSKVEAGKMKLELEPLNVGDLVHASLQVVREKAMARRMRLVTEVADGLGELGNVWLDERKVKQILNNLLSNAVKFTPEGGEVHIAARRVGREALPDGHFEHYLEFAVTDTGIGISIADQTRLFQPFTQIDSTLGRRYEGTGLGLVMVKRLTELHGGEVAMQSTPKKGSTFTVRLPWRTEADKVADISAPDKPFEPDKL